MSPARHPAPALPPHPRPWFVMQQNEAAHDSAWIVYANGEEVARVASREELATLTLTPPRSA